MSEPTCGDCVVSALAYFAECEADNRHPAASEEMFELERAGLLTAIDVGWGHRRIALTPKGRAQLGAK